MLVLGIGFAIPLSMVRAIETEEIASNNVVATAVNPAVDDLREAPSTDAELTPAKEEPVNVRVAAASAAGRRRC